MFNIQNSWNKKKQKSVTIFSFWLYIHYIKSWLSYNGSYKDVIEEINQSLSLQDSLTFARTTWLLWNTYKSLNNNDAYSINTEVTLTITSPFLIQQIRRVKLVEGDKINYSMIHKNMKLLRKVNRIGVSELMLPKAQISKSTAKFIDLRREITLVLDYDYNS